MITGACDVTHCRTAMADYLPFIPTRALVRCAQLRSGGKGAVMRNMIFCSFTAFCLRRDCRFFAGILLAFSAMTFLVTGPISLSQDSKSQGVLPAPSPGKAIVCIFRTYRFTGSAAHDEIFVNDTHLGKLLSSEYEFTEVPPGTVVIAGLPKMYYGSVIMSAGAALNQARQKENERARFAAEPGKTYYFKWTSGTMATMIKVTPVDPETGAKEIHKLHLSAPPEDKEEAKQETGKPESAKPDDAKPDANEKPAPQ
jgi:hypothetical protein